MKDLVTINLGEYIHKATENRVTFKFPNGRGASLINNGYGSSEGLFEIAVLDKNRDLDYTTPLTDDDVLGNLTHEEVIETLNQIMVLP